MLVDICKRDIDSEIDLGSKYFTDEDNGKCYYCRVIGKCVDLHEKIRFLSNCDECKENSKKICRSCVSYLAYLIQNNKFNRLIRLNIRLINELKDANDNVLWL